MKLFNETINSEIKTNFNYFSPADQKTEFFKMAASENQKLHFTEKSGFRGLL